MYKATKSCFFKSNVFITAMVTVHTTLKELKNELFQLGGVKVWPPVFEFPAVLTVMLHVCGIHLVQALQDQSCSSL